MSNENKHDTDVTDLYNKLKTNEISFVEVYEELAEKLVSLDKYYNKDQNTVSDFLIPKH